MLCYQDTFAANCRIWLPCVVITDSKHQLLLHSDWSCCLQSCSLHAYMKSCCTGLVFQQYGRKMLPHVWPSYCRNITQAQARYGSYFHRVLFSGTLQRQQRTCVTLKRVSLTSLERLLMHHQTLPAARSTGSPRSPNKYADSLVDTFFLCVYSANRIVWHGQTAVEVSSCAEGCQD